MCCRHAACCVTQDALSIRMHAADRENSMWLSFNVFAGAGQAVERPARKENELLLC
jgi:hypothetical protein